jgi:Holliday junction DNA helicase RuvA
MIGRLSGVVVHEEADGAVVLEVAGVGYELLVPAGAIARARLAAGAAGEVTLWVHTYVREDALVLYGFAELSDRSAFRILLGISSIGPRTALSLLSSISGPELARAVQSRDAGALVKVPGVGKKTAERLLLELRDKLPSLAAAPSAGAAAAPEQPWASGARGVLVVDALTRLGFKRSEAERAVEALGGAVEAEPTEKSIRDALTVLRR